METQTPKSPMLKQVRQKTGNPLKRVILRFAEMSTFLPLKTPFIVVQMSCQPAQMSRAAHCNMNTSVTISVVNE